MKEEGKAEHVREKEGRGQRCARLNVCVVCLIRALLCMSVEGVCVKHVHDMCVCVGAPITAIVYSVLDCVPLC